MKIIATKKAIFATIVLIGLTAVFGLLVISSVHAQITSITVSPSDAHANTTANYTINFRLPSNAATTTVIDFTFPAGFNVASAGPNPVTVTGMAQQFGLSVSGQIVRLATTTVGSATTSVSQSVIINNIINPARDGAFTITMAATTSAGAATGTSAVFFIQKGTTAVPLDKTAPVSSILNPKSGATIPAGKSYTIEGTGTDNASPVTSVEVSVDGGQTWSLAQVNSVGTYTGASYSWSYVWANPTAGEHTVKVRATDAKNNVESPGPSVSVTVAGEAQVEQPAPAPEKPITEMTVSELQTKLAQLQQQLISLLQQLLSLLTQQLQSLTR